MRYQIFSLQQEKLIKYGLGVEEALLLDWFLHFKDGKGMKRIFNEEKQDLSYWVSYDKVIADLPILFKQPTNDMSKTEIDKINQANKKKLSRMFKGNLSQVLTLTKKVIKKEDNKGMGSMMFVTLERSLIDELKNGGKQETPEPQVEDPQEIDEDVVEDTKQEDSNVIYMKEYIKTQDFKDWLENKKKNGSPIATTNKITQMIQCSMELKRLGYTVID